MLELMLKFAYNYKLRDVNPTFTQFSLNYSNINHELYL